MLKHAVSVMWISTYLSHSSHWCPLQVQEEDSSITMNVKFIFAYIVSHLTSIRIFVKLSHFLLKLKNTKAMSKLWATWVVRQFLYKTS
jgi:hypothetical protein